MPSPLRDPKALSEWLDLDYVHRPRPLWRWWRPLLWGTLLVSLAGVGWTFLPGQRVAYEAGPLSTAHAMFNQDCAKCHTESFQTLSRLTHADSRVASVPDSACTQCHAGPVHHANAARAEERNCASCHREHRGQAVLARVADGQCTTCHADLKVAAGPAPIWDPHITSFGGKHPEFRIWLAPKDPGTIRFNHKVHLVEEGVLMIDRKQVTLQEQKLKALEVEPCGQDLRGPAEPLKCNRCHEMDPAGRYVLPINYERHCKECHPLSVQLVGDWKDRATKEIACRFSATPAPHPRDGETAATVRAALRDRLTEFIQRNPALVQSQPTIEPERPIPGSRRSEPVTPAAHAWVNRQLVPVERVLFDGKGGCQYCHQEQTTPEKRPNGLPTYKEPAIPSRWFKQSTFRHDSHQGLSCTECHTDARTSDTSANVLLPRIATCQRCHSSAGQVRSDCVECHVYHDPARKRDFQGNLDIGTFTRR